MGIDFASFYDFSIRFWNRSDSVIFFFQFYIPYGNNLNRIIALYTPSSRNDNSVKMIVLI